MNFFLTLCSRLPLTPALEPREACHGVLSTAGRERLKGSRAQLDGLREFTEAGRELLMQRDGTFRHGDQNSDVIVTVPGKSTIHSTIACANIPYARGPLDGGGSSFSYLRSYSRRRRG